MQRDVSPHHLPTAVRHPAVAGDPCAARRRQAWRSLVSRAFSKSSLAHGREVLTEQGWCMCAACPRKAPLPAQQRVHLPCTRSPAARATPCQLGLTR